MVKWFFDAEVELKLKLGGYRSYSLNCLGRTLTGPSSTQYPDHLMVAAHVDKNCFRNRYAWKMCCCLQSSRRPPSRWKALVRICSSRPKCRIACAVIWLLEPLFKRVGLSEGVVSYMARLCPKRL